MTRKRIAIIGANGFTGRCFVDNMHQKGVAEQYELVLIDRTAAECGYIEHNPVTEDDAYRSVDSYVLSKVWQKKTALYCFRRYGAPVTSYLCVSALKPS